MKDLIPAQYRKLIYAVVAAASAVVAVPDLIPASYVVKVTAVVAALSSILAAGNVDKPA